MNLWRSISSVSLLTLVSRITGLIRELLIAASFGASVWTDAFNVAFRIPNLLRRLFAEGAFSQAFVPILADSHAQGDADKTKQLVDAVATVLALVLALACLIGIIAAPALVYLLASGLQGGEGFHAATTMTRWMFPYIGFMSLVALGAGILNTWGKFAVAAAAPVLLNMAMIGSALLIIWGGGDWMLKHGWPPVYILAFGVLLGGFFQLLLVLRGLVSIQMVPSIKWGWTGIRKAFTFPGTQLVLKQMAPAILGVSVAQLSLLINTQIASYLQAGSVSWLSYADRLMEFPTAILGVALGVVLLPHLSRTLAKKQYAYYSHLLDWGLRLVVLLALPCAMGLLFFSKPLVAILYNYGQFSIHDMEQTRLALSAYGVGLLGLIAIKVLAPGFYAQKDIKTPVYIAIRVLMLTQAMNFLFVYLLGLHHVGLALSIGLGAMVNALWLFLTLKRKGYYHAQPGWLRFGCQVFVACIVLALYLIFSASYFNWEALRAAPWLRVGTVLLLILGAMVVYFATLALSGCRLKQLIDTPKA